MRSRRIILAIVVTVSLLNAGCVKDIVRELSKNVSDLQVVHDRLRDNFGDDVFVNINEGGGRLALNVVFINSALNDKTKDDRAMRAQQSANVVRLYYPGIQNLNAIWVVFVREKRTLVFISQRESIDYYGFDKDALRVSVYNSGNNGSVPPPPRINYDGPALRTASSYIADDNETDISVSGIQLAGSGGRSGLTMLPHFRLKGDARRINARPPKLVTFNLASYSDHEQFPPHIAIAFIADGKQLLQMKGTFTVFSSPGTYNQILYLNVPYPIFRKMLDATELTIKLGDDMYTLTPTQLATMKEMRVFVNE